MIKKSGKLTLGMLITNLKQRNVLVKFFVVFNLLVIVPVIISNYIIYNYSNRVIDSEIRESNRIVMRNMIGFIDKRLEKIKNNFIYIFSSNSAMNLATSYYPDGYKTTNYYAGLIKELQTYKEQDEMIAEMAIHFPKTDTDHLITSNGLFNFGIFFNKTMIFKGLNAENWRGILSEIYSYKAIGRYEMEENYYTTSKSIIPILSTWPYSSDPKAVCIALIDEGYIKNIISNYNGRSKYYIVVDEDGLVITRSHYENEDIDEDIGKIVKEIRGYGETGYHVSLNGERVSVSYEISELTGWIYMSVVPFSEISKQSAYIRKISLFVCCVFIILGFFIAAWISGRMYRPVSTLVEYIDSLADDSEKSDGSSIGNEYAFISNQVKKIHSANQKLKDSLNSFLPFLHENLLYRILKGNIIPEEEINVELEKFRIEFKYRYFQVILVKTDTTEACKSGLQNLNDSTCAKSRNRIRNIIFTLIRQKFECYAIDTDMSTVAYLINFDEIDRERLQKMCTTITDYFNSEENFLFVTVAVGNVCNNIGNVNDSYRQSFEALCARKASAESQVIFFSDAEERINNPVCNLSLDCQTIYNALLGGGFEDGLLMAVKVFIEGTKKNPSSGNVHNMARTLVNIPLTVMEAKGYSSSEVEVDGEIVALSTERLISIDEYINKIMLTYKRVESIISFRSRSSRETIIDAVLEYVRENYNKEIYLDAIANEINISTNYLSHFFKKMVGVSFPDYLKRVRIEKAKELLRSTGKTVNEICNEIGYLNVNSFIRTFKEIEGTTPGRYRELKKN